MELRQYVLALRKSWGIIAVLTILGGVAGYGYAQTVEPTYRANTKIFVALSGGQSAGELVQGSTFVQNSIQSFVQLVSMPVVLQPVIDDLDLDTTTSRLSGAVSASNPINTFIIQISVVGTDPEEIADIANAVGVQLAKTVAELSPSSEATGDAIALHTVASATAPKYPFAPNARLLLAIGVVGGLGTGLIIAFAAATLDTLVRAVSDVTRLTRLPLLGTITRARDARSARATVLSDPQSVRAESFRRLQTNLKYLDLAHDLRTITVTSAIAAEGKTSTAINLALAAAEKGMSVLLVDADLRRPTLGNVLHLEYAAGLTSVLIGRASLEDVVQEWGIPGLHVLTSGEIPPNPSQLLDSGTMHDLVRDVAKQYDLVIFDSAPVLPVVDSAVLGRVTDGILMVIGLRRVRRQQVRSALDSLSAVGARVLGVVAVGVKDSDGPGGYQYRASSPRAATPSLSRLAKARHGGT